MSSVRLEELLWECPIIAAVRDEAGLKKALQSQSEIVFILYGTVLNIKKIVGRVKEAGKCPIVHMDLVSGLSPKEIAVEYLKENTGTEGIISTKPSLIHRGKELGLLTVQRFFLIDSMALYGAKKHIQQTQPDCVEIMPGIIPRVLEEIHEFTRIPIIAGGLLADKKDIMTALDAGAAAVSTTNEMMWEF